MNRARLLLRLGGSQASGWPVEAGTQPWRRGLEVVLCLESRRRAGVRAACSPGGVVAEVIA